VFKAPPTTQSHLGASCTTFLYHKTSSKKVLENRKVNRQKGRNIKTDRERKRERDRKQEPLTT